ncbi:MAG: transcriptional regulator [Deltaproteobacteria bacterium]|jgi:prophage regulatory protein|nr:transcriptional regulator [Deltaproteobacteria bacterium]
MEIISKKTTLPETGFVRLRDIIGAPKANPPITPIYPVSKSTWWAGIKAGRYPKPIRISTRVSGWRVEDIRRLIRDSERDVCNG